MKLVLFDDFLPGVLKSEAVVDISGVVKDVPHLDGQTWMAGIIGKFDHYRAAIDAEVESTTGVSLNEVQLRPPLPEPGRIICMAGNYKEGGSNKGDRDSFLKSPSAIIGHGGTILLPDVAAPHFHHEAELGVVIGKEAHKIRESDAKDYIFGFLNFIDVSARGLNPNGNNSFWWQKSWDTFAPIGPSIVTADEISDPQDLGIKLWVSGDLRQDLRTDDMARSVYETLEYVTWITTVKPGDIIATGTNHVGLGPIQDGDVIKMEIDGLGRLEVDVRDDWKRTWPRETLSDMSAFESSVGARWRA